MKLDSVRELKHDIVQKILPKIEASILTRAEPRRVPSIVGADSAPASFALGVSSDGRAGYRLAIRVQRRVFQSSREIELITRQAKGEVDIRYVGRIAKRSAPWHQSHQRPLLTGCSVGHHRGAIGTLGAIVRRRGVDAPCLLSNNHILANENNAKKGDAILQPGPIDGGQHRDGVVGYLLHFVRLKKSSSNFVDCALAALDGRIEADFTKLKGLGRLAGLGTLSLGDRVTKIGRTTGLTRGRIRAFEFDNVVVDFDQGNLRFENQVEIEDEGAEPFCDEGDSGALIVGEDLRGVALLFAGGDQGGANGQGLTYANPLVTVLEALKAELAL